MQDLNTGERYEDFEREIIDAAEREAAALITGAQREKAMILRAAKHSVAQSTYDKLSESAEHWRFGAKATETQNARRNLLLYREELTKKLADKVRVRLISFAKSAEYEKYLSKTLDANADLLNLSGIVVSCREADLPIVEKLLAKYTATAELSSDITLGGLRISNGHKIYDETMDAALVYEQERFLSYCGLKVV